MSQPSALALAGMFRPRKRGPGFGIPVFRSQDTYWVQQVREDGRVAGFTACDVEADGLRPRPTEPVQVPEVGQLALYCFEASDGSVFVGTRQELKRRLEQYVTTLRGNPFVLHDVASFLEDATLTAEAAVLCDNVLTQARTNQRSPIVARDGSAWPAAILREYEEWGLLSVDLVNPPRRLTGAENLSWAAVDIAVDQRRTRPLPTPARLLADLPTDDNWSAQSRRSLARLWAHFIVCEDPQRRLDAREVSTLAHQMSLVRYVLATDSLRRVLIADEVGLGKTVEVGLIVKELLEKDAGLRVLYLTPARLVRNVRREFDRLGLSFRQWSADDQDAALTDAHIVASIHRAVHQANRADVLEAGPWDILIVDECHHLSDWAAGGGDPRENFKLVRDLIGRLAPTGRVLFLSGTPHQGHVSRFENLLNLLRAPGEDASALSGRVIYRTKDDVVDWNNEPLFPARQVNEPLIFDAGPEYQAWIKNIHEFYRPSQGSVTGARQRAAGWRCAQALQWAASSPHAGMGYLVRQALRAKWQLSVPVLKEAIEALRPYRMGRADEPVEELFQRLRQEVQRQQLSGDVEDIEEGVDGGFDDVGRRQLEALLGEGLECLKREPYKKWQFIREKLLDPAGHDKVVLFAQPIETVTALAHFLLKATGIAPGFIVGGQSDHARTAEIDRFTKPGGPQFLVSSRAGGEGINLQIAHRLVHVDVPWNPMELEQRVGRIHRFGSTQTIIVDTVVVKNSREADAYRVARERLQLIASTVVEPARFETLFGRVMALIPPEELQNVLITDALAPLTGTEQESIARIVREGFSRWRTFHDEYAESQRRISRLDPGLATWDDVRRGLEKYANAHAASGYTAQRFRRDDSGVHSIDEPVPVVTLGDGADYLVADSAGARVWGPDGNPPVALGVNRPPLAEYVSKLAFPTTPTGAAYLRWPGQRPNMLGEGQFAVLVLMRQSVHLRGRATWDEGESQLHTYVLQKDGGATRLSGEEKATILRGLFDATIRVRPDAADVFLGVLQSEESRLVNELQRPDQSELERGVRHAVYPLLAAVVI